MLSNYPAGYPSLDDTEELPVYWFRNAPKGGTLYLDHEMTDDEIAVEYECLRGRENVSMMYDTDGESPLGFIALFAEDENPDRAWDERE